jgi:hypothetical protein
VGNQLKIPRYNLARFLLKLNRTCFQVRDFCLYFVLEYVFQSASDTSYALDYDNPFLSKPALA